MRGLIRKAIENAPAMNLIMITVLLVGSFSLISIQREAFPTFNMDIVQVRVPYPGATPEEVEEGVCQKVEEVVRGVNGIKKISSIAAEGMATISIELKSSVDSPDRVINEIRSEVDQITSFPEFAEEPEIRQMTMRETSIKVGVIGPNTLGDATNWQLREMAEEVRSELLMLPGVSEVEIIGAPAYQIDVEFPEQALRAYNLSLKDAANIIRRENHQMPAGSIRSNSQELLVRGENRRTDGEGISALPLITKYDGTVLTVGDLGNVEDGFEDTAFVSRINGQPSLGLAVQRTSDEDILEMVASVYEYIATKKLPAGYSLSSWSDRSIEVRGRLNLLLKNGVQGLCLVFLALALFLNMRLAFWVAMGIPFSVLAAGTYLLFTDQTLNMISMFAFVMALGIVVDDAIVVGENVFAHREMGKSLEHAAIDGTLEVMPPVITSVVTTIIAFMPLLYVTGMMGKFIAVMPVGVIAMLIASLLESGTILPSHLSHKDNLVFRILGVIFYAVRWILIPFNRLRSLASKSLKIFVESIYAPTLHLALHHRSVVISGAIAMLMIALGFVRSGYVPFIVLPKLDSNIIVANVVFPDGTPERITNHWTSNLEQAFQRVSVNLDQVNMATVVHRVVGQEMKMGGFRQTGSGNRGSHIGGVEIELVDVVERSITSDQIVNLWRKEVGQINGAERVQFGSAVGGPAGVAIELKLLANKDSASDLETVAEDIKSKLASYPGVVDIRDDTNVGKFEFRTRVKDDAIALGVQPADIAETLRATYHGEEVMRLQRGRHEVRLMVRYPRDERCDLSHFDEIRLRTGDGKERPLSEVAEVTVERGYSTINRRNQLRAITVSADVNETLANSNQITKELKQKFLPELLRKYPEVQVLWEGQAEQTNESFNSLGAGFGVALLAMFVLLSFQFNSYFQPLLILAIIPFGTIGAIAGHFIMGLPLTMFSVFGMVALTGIVINDSIVLVDFINTRVRDQGIPIEQAIIEAGKRRFRPVILTSLTTVLGLLPILSESSIQAQLLIPMATSLSFGLIFATFLVLYLIPVFNSSYATLTGVIDTHSSPVYQQN
ncbi:efflux RND transporter permease subunit [Gimesia aquarii]|uniref:Toluene efflux pump membrane transporter TtgE n=1 Tax=Gimesia aquarii TaxID=2527964 RepID=A0A517WWP4_9PLAN|nr:efflux RND transporter permease subunit [Gimesia aquarii]QDU09700.1 Toluene efflux pump membrane transporter TtgE [Gimesia aquarii]